MIGSDFVKQGSPQQVGSRPYAKLLLFKRIKKIPRYHPRDLCTDYAVNSGKQSVHTISNTARKPKLSSENSLTYAPIFFG